MTEFINGVEYLYTIPAEEPTSYWILVAFGVCWDAETALCRNSSATTAKEEKARMKNER